MVKFGVEDGDGSVISFSLCAVLYIPVWASSSLISWRKIAFKCQMIELYHCVFEEWDSSFSVRSIGPGLYELPALVNLNFRTNPQTPHHI